MTDTENLPAAVARSLSRKAPAAQRPPPSIFDPRSWVTNPTAEPPFFRRHFINDILQSPIAEYHTDGGRDSP
jgi:hypothetical protein